MMHFCKIGRWFQISHFPPSHLSLHKVLLRLRVPPVLQVAHPVELAALVIKSVGDLVSDHGSDAPVVHSSKDRKLVF